MKKLEFYVRDLSVRVVRSIAIPTLIAGISFFFNPVFAENVEPTFNEAVKIESPVPAKSIVVENTIYEYPIEPTFSDDIIASVNISKELLPVCEFIIKGTSGIQFENVKIKANEETGNINVAYVMPDGAILSINKRLSSMDDTYVAFNIFKNRELIISDIQDIHALSTYICSVQEKLEA